LLACREDTNHPLRTLYRPTRKTGNSGENIVGFERIQVETTDLVAPGFYEKMFEETGIPITIHPFYSSVFEKYHST